MAGLCFCLLAGCASSPTQSRKVYDRYAELVAARTRAAQSPTNKVSEAADRRSSNAKSTPNAHPAGAAKSVPPAPEVKPAPLHPSPGAVVAPVPAEVPTPVQPAPAQAAPPPVQVVSSIPATEVPAPVQPAPVQSVPVSESMPAPTVPPPPPAPVDFVAASSTDGVAYLLKVGDVIQIFLRGIPTSDAIEDVIDENGNVSLPLINEVRAAGMTAAELERNIRRIYLDQDIYRNIAVTVVVPTRYYFIQGEIKGPGRFQLVSATRVSQAIAGAGGYTEYASGQVVVKRGGKIVKTIRNAKRLERTPEDDVLLEPDDIIEVRRSLW